jgi:hypothetical protein
MMTLEEAVAGWLVEGEEFYERRKELLAEVNNNPMILRMAMQLRDSGSLPTMAIVSAISIGICIGIDMEKERRGR